MFVGCFLKAILCLALLSDLLSKAEKKMSLIQASQRFAAVVNAT